MICSNCEHEIDGDKIFPKDSKKVLCKDCYLKSIGIRPKIVKTAENCDNSINGKHCGNCHDINEGYKFFPYWKAKGE